MPADNDLTISLRINRQGPGQGVAHEDPNEYSQYSNQAHAIPLQKYPTVILNDNYRNGQLY